MESTLFSSQVIIVRVHSRPSISTLLHQLQPREWGEPLEVCAKNAIYEELYKRIRSEYVALQIEHIVDCSVVNQNASSPVHLGETALKRPSPSLSTIWPEHV